MKKIFSLFLIGAAALSAEPLIESQPILMTEPQIPNIEISEKRSFGYAGVGASGFILPLMPDTYIGRRTLDSHHVWDLCAGLNSAPLPILAYGQTSYLYYLTPSKGPYIGVGLTVGVFNNRVFRNLIPIPDGSSSNLFSGGRVAPYINLPITVGYQFEKDRKGNHNFIQFQVTPLATTSVSYAWGF